MVTGEVVAVVGCVSDHANVGMAEPTAGECGDPHPTETNMCS